MDEAEGVEKRLPRIGLGCLLSIMQHYTMAVKSALAGAFRKSFGDWWLEPLRGCGEDAIFAGFGGGLSLLLRFKCSAAVFSAASPDMKAQKCYAEAKDASLGGAAFARDLRPFGR